MIPVAALVSLPGFESGPMTVERFAAPTGVDYRGRPLVATPTELVIDPMVTHQATRRQLRRENVDASDDWRAFYATQAIIGSGANQRPDVIRYGGSRWEVQTVGDYGTLGGVWLALAKRIE